MLVFDSLSAATSNHHSKRWASPAGKEQLNNAVPPVASNQRDRVWKTPNDAAPVSAAGVATAAAPVSEELRKFRERLSKLPITFEHTLYGSYSDDNVLTGGHYAGDKNRLRIVEVVGDPLPSGIYEAKIQLKRAGKRWANKSAGEGASTMFPIHWTPEKIQRKVQDAYNRFCQRAPLNAVKWEDCTEERIVIRGVIEIGRGRGRVSAFPVFKPSRQAGIFGYDPSYSDFTQSR